MSGGHSRDVSLNRSHSGRDSDGDVHRRGRHHHDRGDSSSDRHDHRGIQQQEQQHYHHHHHIDDGGEENGNDNEDVYNSDGGNQMAAKQPQFFKETPRGTGVWRVDHLAGGHTWPRFIVGGLPRFAGRHARRHGAREQEFQYGGADCSKRGGVAKREEEQWVSDDHRVRFHADVSGGTPAAVGGEGPATTDAAVTESAPVAFSRGKKHHALLGADVYTGLHLACLNGSVSRARREVSFGADVNAPASGDGDGASPLHLACRCGSDEVVRLLLSEGADAGQTNIHGESPLHYAAAGGHEIIAARLLAAGSATASAADSRGRTPLHNACDGDTTPDASDSGRVNVARLLVNAGADPGARTTPAMPMPPVAAPSPTNTGVCGAHRQGVAAATGVGGAGLAGSNRGELTGAQPNANAVAAVEGLVVGAGARAGDGVGAGVKVGAGSGADGSDGGGGRRDGREAGMTPLHFACRSGSAELAEYLLRVGASALAKDDGGCQPGDDFSCWVSSEKRHAVETVLQSGRGRQEVSELRKVVASLTERMVATEARGAALASENHGLAERLHQQETRTKGHEQQIAVLEGEVARQRVAIDDGLRRESAFKNETAELANQTRRLGRGIRELAETSPQLREVVRALSGRVDELKKDGEVMGDLSRRLEACEGRLQTRVAELAGKVEGVERSHPPAPQACACSGKLEAVAAKIGVLSGGHGAALRRLDDLTSDVSALERTAKLAEVASITKLDLQAHELGALVERRVAQLRSEVDVQLARAWQLVGRGAGVGGSGGLAAARDGASMARSSILSPRRDGRGVGGSGDGGGDRALTDMVLALQLRVGELDCEVLKRSSSVPRDSVFDAGLRASAATGGGRNIGISGSSVTGTGIGTTGTGDNGGSGGGTPWLNSSGATSDNHHVRFKRNHHHCCTRTGQGAMKSSGKINKALTKARKCRKGLYASRRSSDGGIGAGEEGAGADSEEDVERRLKRLEDAIFLL
eukprot:jgi/Undpi1/4543/HiC_scaffold_18.g07897.m1